MNEPSPNFLSSPDAGNRTAGEIIRRAREAQGITLEALAAMIKVTPVKLEALELGRHDQLPDANFTRALAMTVCRALKVDASEVLAALPAARPAPLAEGKPPLNQPFKESKGSGTLFDRHALNGAAFLTPKYLAPAVLLIAALVIYALPDSVSLPGWRTTPATPPAGGGTAPAVVTENVPVEVPPGSSAVQPLSPGGVAASVPPPMPVQPVDPAGAESAVSGAPPVMAPAPSAAAPSLDARLSAPVSPQSPAAASAAVLPVPASTGALGIAVTAPAWIEVRDAQGRKIFSRLAQPGENLSLDGPAPLRVRIGNVSGVQVRFKGQPVDLVSFSRNNVARLELK